MNRPYEDALASCVAALCKSRDGEGWGISPGAIASVVNTAEVLVVLKAARDNSVHVPDEIDRRAREWLASVVPEHCRPRAEGGRGEKTRYVTFGLLGLSTEPGHLSSDTVAEAIVWCLQWLLDHRLDDGWPEEAGIHDASIFQTSAALSGASQFLMAASGVALSPLLASATDKARRVIEDGIPRLLAHRLESGSWPRQTSVDNPSASKTSLALLALQDAWDAVGRESAYSTSSRALPGLVTQTPRQILDGGTDWLLSNAPYWVHLMEGDPDVTGTIWSHLAYALGVQALARARTRGLDERTGPAWQLIVEYWDADYSLWKEPSTPPVPTVRATYAAVCALESVRRTHGEIGLRDVVKLVARQRGPVDSAAVDLVRSFTDQFSLVWTLQGGRSINLTDLSPRESDLLKLLSANAGPPPSLTARHISTALKISEASVGTYVRRLNGRINKAAGGKMKRLVASERRKGYWLSVQRVVRRQF